MGYYTRYSMEIQDIDHKGYDSYKIAKYMLDKQEESDRFYAFEYELKDFVDNEDTESRAEYELSLDGDDECKWYDNEDDMLLLSKEFPDIVISSRIRLARNFNDYLFADKISEEDAAKMIK